MGVTSKTFTQYYVQCDICGCEDVVADNNTERVHSKQQAIKWAKMHKVKGEGILCDDCFKEKNNLIRDFDSM